MKFSITQTTLSLMLCSLLCACAPGTVLGLKESGTHSEAQVQRGYQAAYRNVLSGVDNCVYGGFITAPILVQSNLYTDNKTGIISIILNNMGDKSVFVHIEIADVDGNSTINTYNAPVWKNFNEKVVRWANGASTDCS